LKAILLSQLCWNYCGERRKNWMMKNIFAQVNAKHMTKMKSLLEEIVDLDVVNSEIWP
jgi:hypothetical protein